MASHSIFDFNKLYSSEKSILNGSGYENGSTEVLDGLILYSPLTISSPYTLFLVDFNVCSSEMLVISDKFVLKVISFLNGIIF